MVNERKHEISRFGKVLNRLLKSRELSGLELCRLSDLAMRCIGHYVIGRQSPRKESVKRMAKVLEVPECLLAWFAYTIDDDSALFKGVEAIMQEALRYSIKDYEEIKMEI